MILEDLFVKIKEKYKKVVSYAVVSIIGIVIGFILCFVIICGSNADGSGVQGVSENIENVGIGITEAEDAINHASGVSRSIGVGLGRCQDIVNRLENSAQQFANILGQIQKREGIRALDIPGRDSDIKRRHYLYGS